jgi:hypothetical protein
MQNARLEFEPGREFEILPRLTKFGEHLQIGRMVTWKGVSFPVGGLLLLIGRKSLTAS